MNEEFPLDRDADNFWDRIWRGRASSQRRHLKNVAIETARCAALIDEGARLVDHLPDANRQVEILDVCNELDELIESIKTVSNHLREEAGDVGVRRPGPLVRIWRWLLAE